MYIGVDYTHSDSPGSRFRSAAACIAFAMPPKTRIGISAISSLRNKWLTETSGLKSDSNNTDWPTFRWHICIRPRRLWSYFTNLSCAQRITNGHTAVKLENSITKLHGNDELPVKIMSDLDGLVRFVYLVHVTIVCHIMAIVLSNHYVRARRIKRRDTPFCNGIVTKKITPNMMLLSSSVSDLAVLCRSTQYMLCQIPRVNSFWMQSTCKPLYKGVMEKHCVLA